jgi:hypothetical protein
LAAPVRVTNVAMLEIASLQTLVDIREEPTSPR